MGPDIRIPPTNRRSRHSHGFPGAGKPGQRESSRQPCHTGQTMRPRKIDRGPTEGTNLPSMKLTAIVAMTAERVIGRNGTLPWHLPADLAFFKRTTSGHPVVMGRTTFESIGRPLPNRRNIILTRDPAWHAQGVEVIHSPKDLDTLGLDGEVFIIGGSQVYQAFLPRLDEVLVSHIVHPYPGDTFLPPFESAFGPPQTVEIHPDFEVRRYSRHPAA